MLRPRFAAAILAISTALIFTEATPAFANTVVWNSETSNAAAQSAELRDYWSPCGTSNSDQKIVRSFDRMGFPGLPAGKSRLRCGSKKWGYNHIKVRHINEWQKDAEAVHKNWRDQADWTIAAVLRDPEKITYRKSKDTFCFSRKVYLEYNGKVVGTRQPNVIVAHDSQNIITAWPANDECKWQN